MEEILTNVIRLVTVCRNVKIVLVVITVHAIHILKLTILIGGSVWPKTHVLLILTLVAIMFATKIATSEQLVLVELISSCKVIERHVKTLMNVIQLKTSIVAIRLVQIPQEVISVRVRKVLS